jgi:predicted regulator of Ras-like GTPase activity (Roadblock/LC7/MglB family)
MAMLGVSWDGLVLVGNVVRERERENLVAFNSAIHNLLKLTYANILATAVE